MTPVCFLPRRPRRTLEQSAWSFKESKFLRIPGGSKASRFPPLLVSCMKTQKKRGLTSRSAFPNKTSTLPWYSYIDPSFGAVRNHDRKILEVKLLDILPWVTFIFRYRPEGRVSAPFRGHCVLPMHLQRFFRQRESSRTRSKVRSGPERMKTMKWRMTTMKKRRQRFTP